MADTRELILSRLVVVCAAVPGVQAAARNKLDVPALVRPAVIVQDGAETLLDAPQGMRGSRVQRLELSPAILIVVRGDNGAEAGSLLTLYRNRIVSAVLADAILLDAVVDGGIRYEGISVAAPDAEAREYRGELNLVFTTLFRLTDILTEAPLSGPVRVEHPSSGAAIVLAAGQYALYVTTGPLDALTVRLPPGVPAGAPPVEISFAAPVSDLVVQDSAGAVLPSAPTSGYGPGAALQFRYIDPTLGWVYWK